MLSHVYIMQSILYMAVCPHRLPRLFLSPLPRKLCEFAESQAHILPSPSLLHGHFVSCQPSLAGMSCCAPRCMMFDGCLGLTIAIM